MSRLKNTIKNAKIGIFFHVIFIFVQFFSRKIFLDGLGDTFIGTTATLQSFLGFLNLAELGIGTAIGFALYKPIFDKNHKEINLIINFVGGLYKKIGLIVITTGLVLSIFFPIIFKDTDLNLFLIYYAYFTFLLGSVLGYFLNYHVFLIQADQKEYILSKYYQSFTITKIIIQGFSVYFFQNIFIWITLELFFNSFYAIAIRNKIKREYPWLKVGFSETRNIPDFTSKVVLLKKIKQISVHKLGGVLNSGTDNILIFYFISAQSVAFFGNYQLVILNLGILIEKLFSGSSASVGNLVAENDLDKIKKVFWELMSLRFFIGGVTVSSILLLINPFISLWLGEKYILDNLIIILFASIFFIRQIVQPIEIFKQAYGLYGDTWAPLTEGLINISISIFFAQKYGLSGILLGTNISIILIVLIWRPIYVFKSGFKFPYLDYVKGFVLFLFISTLGFFITKYLAYSFVDLNIKNYGQLILSTIKVGLITIIIYGGLLYFLTKSFKSVTSRLLNQVIK